MKDYTNIEPNFHEKISVIETTDPVHANVVNTPIQQIMDNTLYLKKRLETDNVTVDEELDEESENPVQNAAVAAAFKELNETIAEIKKMLPAEAPTAEDAGKVLKVNADGKVELAEGYGSNWLARYPQFLADSETYISGDRSHVVETDEFGCVLTADISSDRNVITEVLSGPDGETLAKATNMFSNERKHISKKVERKVDADGMGTDLDSGGDQGENAGD